MKHGRVTHDGSVAQLERQDSHLVEHLKAELTEFERLDRERMEAEQQHTNQLREIHMMENMRRKGRHHSMSTSSGGYR